MKNESILSDYAVDARYPGNFEEEPNKENYIDALELAEYVYYWVDEQIRMI